MAVEAVGDFVVQYDGEAVRSGRMPVRDLAPSLLALADVVQEANAVSSTSSPSVSLEIRSFEQGSFDVWLVPALVVGLLSSDAASAAANLISLSTEGLDLLRRIRGRKVLQREPLGANQTRLLLDDHTEITTSSDAVVLVDRSRFRRGALGFVRPLRQPEMERLRIVVNGRPRLDIMAGDAGSFDEPPRDTGTDVVAESEVQLTLLVAAPSFIEGNKWRLNDGEHTDWYVMGDEAFLERVSEGEVAFRKGDLLECRVRFEQTRDPLGALHLERRIVAVLHHGAAVG